MKQGTSLNAVFREWLQVYTSRESPSQSYRDLMAELSGASAGGHFSREELNER